MLFKDLGSSSLICLGFEFFTEKAVYVTSVVCTVLYLVSLIYFKQPRRTTIMHPKAVDILSVYAQFGDADYIGEPRFLSSYICSKQRILPMQRSGMPSGVLAAFFP